MASIHDVKKIPREEWRDVNVDKVLDTRLTDFCVHPGDDATNAMSMMVKNGLGRVPVLDSGKLAGIVSHRDIMHIIKHKVDLKV